ncbi:MAG: hypothetical protein E8D45_05140 [Nitrospira sp.]|nr:MAG: hypothetical protein E8D45_05140 [Nitrospira sp.]
MPIVGGSSLRQGRAPLLVRCRVPLIAIAVICTAATLLVGTQESNAIPAWARKYNADCAMCHYAAFPRLNSFGLQFRRMGYRTPTEVNKDQDVSNVGNFLAGRLRTQFGYDNTKGNVERSEFRFPEVSIMYAGAISRHWSAYIHGFANNGSSVDMHGHVMGMFGDHDKYFMVRIGQMHMLNQEGLGGFDRPVGISSTPIHGTALTRNAAPSNFNFDLRQRGAELAYVYGPGRLFAQITNGLDETGSGVRRGTDINPQKDFLVGYDHILDEIASSFTVFYYNGTTHGTVTPTAATGLALPDGANTSLANTFSYSRFGFNANKVFTVPGHGFFEVLGGFVRSYDNVSRVTGDDVGGNSFYAETQQYITGPELTFFQRFSLIDLDGGKKNTTRKDYTFGAVTPLETWLRLAGEYTYTDNRNTGITAHVALVELQAVW